MQYELFNLNFKKTWSYQVPPKIGFDGYPNLPNGCILNY